MKLILTPLALLMVVTNACSYTYAPYCCHGVEYSNQCFAAQANEDLNECQNTQCEAFEDISDTSNEWINVEQYVTILDGQINAKLLDSGVRFNYGCHDHQQLKQAKMQKVTNERINYWVTLQLLCDPLGYYGHIYFYVGTIDNMGHVLMPHPELAAIEYPKLPSDSLETFRIDNIIINSTNSTV